MADDYAAPFGTYTNVAGVIAATPAGQVVTVRDQLLAMFVLPTAGTEATRPNFDRIPPDMVIAIRAEITAAFAAIAAAPTA